MLTSLRRFAGEGRLGLGRGLYKNSPLSERNQQSKESCFFLSYVWDITYCLGAPIFIKEKTLFTPKLTKESNMVSVVLRGVGFGQKPSNWG